MQKFLIEYGQQKPVPVSQLTLSFLANIFFFLIKNFFFRAYFSGYGGSELPSGNEQHAVQHATIEQQVWVDHLKVMSMKTAKIINKYIFRNGNNY